MALIRALLGVGLILVSAGTQIGGCSFTHHSANPMAGTSAIGGGGGGGGPGAPTVTVTMPAAGATGVALSVTANVTFSTNMDTTKINSSNLFLYTTSASSPVSATVTYTLSTMTAAIKPTGNLMPNTLYTLEVTTSVTDTAGTPMAANYVSTFTTGTAPDTTPPTFAGATSATATGSASIQVNWSPATDPDSPTGILYDAYVSTTPTISFTSPTATSAPDATSMVITGLSPSTTYYIVVRARDASGNRETNTQQVSATTSALTDTTPPTFGGPTTTSVSGTSITVNWTAASDPDSPTLITYKVYASTTNPAPYSTPVGQVVDGTSYTITGLASLTTFYIGVRATDKNGNTETNTHQIVATTADTTAPTMSSFSAGATTQTTIPLSWTAASDPDSPTGLVYLVYASTAPISFSTDLKVTTAADALSATLSGLSPGMTYNVVVRAKDPSGNTSNNTSPITVTTQSSSTSTVSFSTQIYPSLKTNCGIGGCHDGGQFPTMNQATTGAMYTTLVNQNSGGRYAGAKLIDGAGKNTSNSEIWNSLHQNGGSMPAGGTFSTTDLNNLQAWILAGALNN